MTHDCTDAIRCTECAEAEQRPVCEVCGDEYDADEGCQDDGHSYCPEHLAECPECLANIRDDVSAETWRDA